nr:ribosomal protein S4 [Navicula sp.]
MTTEKKRKNKILHKKIIRLRINPLNNDKFLQLVKDEKKELYKNKYNGRLQTRIKTHFIEIEKKKKNKWKNFLKLLVRANKFHQKYKPFTFHYQSVPKIAGQGNSFKKKFKKDLFVKKIFNIYYGGLRRKPLKKEMTKIYKQSIQKNNNGSFCIEMFESRLYVILKKVYFCSTVREAKQLIANGQIKVNNVTENNCNHILKHGDLISVNYNYHKTIKSKLKTKFEDQFDKIIWPTTPSYLNINYNTLEIIVGNIKNFKFCSSFQFKNDNERVVESHYRH